MADVELVIKIPEGLKHDFELEQWTALSCMEMKDALEKAKPLPKGHGDLKDAEKLKHAFITWSTAVRGVFTDVDIASIICNSPTIIEADKKSEE